jgi:hypothetical protein
MGVVAKRHGLLLYSAFFIEQTSFSESVQVIIQYYYLWYVVRCSVYYQRRDMLTGEHSLHIYTKTIVPYRSAQLHPLAFQFQTLSSRPL